MLHWFASTSDIYQNIFLLLQQTVLIFAQVVVPDNQLSLAIGKSGQNARLAARLTNWKIDIKSESQIREILLAQMAEEENEVEADVESEEVANEEE